MRQDTGREEGWPGVAFVPAEQHTTLALLPCRSAGLWQVEREARTSIPLLRGDQLRINREPCEEIKGL